MNSSRLSVLVRGVWPCAIWLGIWPLAGQTRSEPKPLLSEQVFKDVQVLKGIPVSEFMATMGFFSASLGENCTYCHGEESGGSWEKYADDNAHKRTARAMIAMVTAINKSYFAGRRMLTCYSCHRGGERPRITPNLTELYGPPVPEEPDDIQAAPGAPSADQIFDRYIQALGGSERLAALTSFVAKGSYIGYADTEKSTVEIYAQAPRQRTTIVHTANGDATTVYNGAAGWTAAPLANRPVPLLALAGQELDGARFDAELSFPVRIKQALSGWRVGFAATIGDRDVDVVQASTAARSTVRLYFDKETGLLLRQVRYTDSPVGMSPMQLDYADYREVAGVKMPFRWTVTWLDGRSTYELSEVQPNVAIDAAQFAQPAAPGGVRRQ
jgi:photosynthetic reaction center cytochrome c subunit